MRFLSRVLATVVGIFLSFILLFCGILFLFFIFSSSHSVSVKKNSVIELDLSKVKNDYGGKTHFLDFNSFEVSHDGLSDIIKAIQIAKNDDKIRGISILNNKSSLGIAQTKELRSVLEDFKTSSKFVYSYSNTYTQKEYYLNSVANKIYINPLGSLDFKGLSTEIMFFKDFQTKTGLKMEVIRHGKYKSAVEPFLENKMSDANRYQITTLLNNIWNSVVSDISKSRMISVATLNKIATGLLVRTPEMALNQKFIDVVAYEDIYHNDIKKILNLPEDKDYNKIDIIEYAENVSSIGSMHSSNKIAVIYAQGEIQTGEGDLDIIGEKSMNRSIKEARENKNIKAIVLRVNSPGGNALTSELIWREIELTKKVKPVIVSMGNYAASGGYYISCNADYIFAENTTITGSIGVFGIFPNFNEVANKYGIHTEQIRTHENASNYNPFMPLDPKFKNFAIETIEQIYNTFLTRVAQGRKMPINLVDSIASGRVWSGSDAIKIGLVDKIGSLNDAINYAAKISNTKKYNTVDYPLYEKNYRDILDKLPFIESKSDMIKGEIGEENFQILQNIKKIKDRKGIQALMPYKIDLNNGF